MRKTEQQHITETGAFNTFSDLITVAASGLRPDCVNFDAVRIRAGRQMLYVFAV